ncbi:cytochrome B [Roseivirga sp.]|uniref:cytochrome B n=1 Tax=Roseivirga sp. TaxID=1964215 RepID=UPI003B523952
MYKGLVHAHSGLRWIILILLLAAIFNAFSKKKNGIWTAKDKKISLFAMVFTHVQLILGLVLYFMSDYVQFSDGFMKNPIYRFYSIEHITLMILAIIAITVGYSKSKRAASDIQKFKAVFTWYVIGLLLILAGIPWPMRIETAGWF